jgi:hypothetical protein
VPSNGWKSQTSPFVDGTVIDNFNAVTDGIQAGRIDFTIASGALDLNLQEVRLELLNATTCCSGTVISPAPMITSMAIVPKSDGDYDDDGDVDGRDLLVWQRGFGSTTELAADGNHNGTVNGDDLIIWQDQYGANAPPTAVTAVPEPTSAWLSVAALLSLLSQAMVAKQSMNRCR